MKTIDYVSKALVVEGLMTCEASVGSSNSTHNKKLAKLLLNNLSTLVQSWVFDQTSPTAQV